MADPFAILRAEDTGTIDRASVGCGVSGRRLMATAARAATRAITAKYRPCRTAVLCGPGNNGGDGLLVAYRLGRLGWPVKILTRSGWPAWKGDAAWAKSVVELEVGELENAVWANYGLIVDALFGVGFNRPLHDSMLSVFQDIADAQIPVVAIDILSGINGTTGDVACGPWSAEMTVTFQTPKRGHLLLPGRTKTGDLQIADIGIPGRAMAELGAKDAINLPCLWSKFLPRRQAADHKYRAGHTFVLGGPAGRTGASTMTAQAALNVGSGLVTAICQPDDRISYESRLFEVMLKPVADLAGLCENLADERVSSIVVGPAFGHGKRQADWLEVALRRGVPLVVDADAISLMAGDRERFIGLLHQKVVLTPHDGEFARLFNVSGDRLERAKRAVERLGCHIVLKGGETAIASPDGRAALTVHAPPTLATAGSGDVLAGLIGGLIAQSMPVYEAACAAVWLHGQAARHINRVTATQLCKPDTLAKAFTDAKG